MKDILQNKIMNTIIKIMRTTIKIAMMTVKTKNLNLKMKEEMVMVKKVKDMNLKMKEEMHKETRQTTYHPALGQFKLGDLSDALIADA